jgi:hypothetical protein
MAPGAGLTARQKQLLDLAIRENHLIETFYLSGGTALSSWYLHHRESYDLDFFSLIPFNYDRITRWIIHNKENIGYKEVRFDEDYGFLMVYFRYSILESLKIDFHHYTKTRLDETIHWNGLKIDSLLDIAVNKVKTITTLPRTRDYVDLYCILQKKQWNIGSLIKKSTLKFQEEIDTMQLAKNFLKVSEYTDFPRMLIPFNKKDMVSFYEDLAGKLRSKILK